ncbi:MAG: glycoside hydrolase family 3 N-terminal domain-containing protein [Micropruina sp.]|uniref:glycoside hydrolase family 3 protein n=1 Tax=Micropruina sp. TaxID=2737536 RepID=UPI0039E286A2
MAPLTAGLTLREQVGQLNQRLRGWECIERHGRRWRIADRLRAEVDRFGGIGAIYGLFRADAWSGRSWTDGVLPQERAEVAALVCAEVAARSAHGLGPLLVEEAPHGHQALGATLLPVNLAVASGWDTDAYQEASAAVAQELRADGVHLALVSALDMLRDPRWGRAEETFGESPALAAAFTRALVTGMQGFDRSALTDGTGVGVVLKHFAGQGEGQGGRNGHPAVIGPRDLAAIHLPAAHAGVKAGAVGVMAAYNDIDGVPCVANHALLTGLLRDEWGFEGLVMADGLAIDRLVGMVGSLTSAAATALSAGVDLSLWDEAFTHLDDAVDAAPSLATQVAAACARVLAVKSRCGVVGASGVSQATPAPVRDSFRLGAADLINEPAGEPKEPPPRFTGTRGFPRSALWSRQLARSGPILLTNNDRALPLRPGRWLLTGPRADDVTALLGDYVAPVNSEAPPASVAASLARLTDPDREFVRDTESGRLDGAVVVLGGTSHRAYSDEFAANGALAGPAAADCGEGVDLADIRVPAAQLAELDRARAVVGGPVVAVVIAGRPMVLSDVVDRADAVLLAYYPGPYGGEAIAEILLGLVKPSGRLPSTLPAHPGVLPVRHNDREPARYTDVPAPVLFEFGHGLGYGDGCRLELVEATATASAVTLRVRVHADTAANDVIRVHCRRKGGLVWPGDELIAWRRVRFDAGGEQEQIFELSPDEVFARDLAPLARAVSEIRVAGGSHRCTPVTLTRWGL